MAQLSIDTELLAQQYTSLMEPVIQQGESRTSESVELKTGLTVRDVQVIDWLGKLTVRTVTNLTSVRQTVVDPTPTAESRWLPAPHLVENCIRKSAQFDLLTLVNPDSSVREAQIKAFKTHMDVEFYEAAVGNAIVNINDVTGTGTPGVGNASGIQSPYSLLALPVANTITATGGSTITQAIDQVLEAIDAKDVDTVSNPVIVYINSKAKRLLFEDPRYDNWNNMGGQVLADGQLTPYRGVKFVRLSDTDVFGAVSGATDKLLVVAGKPICMGIWSDLSTKIDILPENSYASQIYTSMSMAATRLDEERVFVLDIAAL